MLTHERHRITLWAESFCPEKAHKGLPALTWGKMVPRHLERVASKLRSTWKTSWNPPTWRGRRGSGREKSVCKDLEVRGGSVGVWGTRCSHLGLSPPPTPALPSAADEKREVDRNATGIFLLFLFPIADNWVLLETLLPSHGRETPTLFWVFSCLATAPSQPPLWFLVFPPSWETGSSAQSCDISPPFALLHVGKEITRRPTTPVWHTSRCLLCLHVDVHEAWQTQQG